MPSISRMAATSLALTTLLLLPGTMAAAIRSDELSRCDFDSESQTSPSPAGSAAERRQQNPDLDATVESIFGRPTAGGEQQASADDLESIFGKPPAGGEQNPGADDLESIFGKPTAAAAAAPAAGEIDPALLDNIFNGGPPPPSAGQEIDPALLDSIFNGGPPPPPSAGSDIDPALLDSVFNGAPASNDDGRVLDVGVYMHIIGKPGKNESAEFFLSRSDIDKQIDAMNKYYTPSNISFHLLDADWTEDSLLSSHRGLRTPLAQGLHKGNVSNLNIFWIKPASLLYGGTSLTFMKGEDEKSDGIIVGTNTIPGGSHPVMNMGVTAVHETGHWLGLSHTGFIYPGDCEPNWRNLPNQGNECDANFMSYGSDACLTEFTPEQIREMRNVAINQRGL